VLVETSFLERILFLQKRYPRDLRDCAVRLMLEHRGDYATEWEAIGSIAAKLGIGSTETLRTHVGPPGRGRHR
jgi:transposase-like protein